MPHHPNKCLGPTSCLSVLGIELDSASGSTPSGKIACTAGGNPLLASSSLVPKALIGHLHHAAKVVWPGRMFIQRLIDLLRCFCNRDHSIHINQEPHLDLQWWQQFLSSWHGMGFWLYPSISATADLDVTSDAAGSLGHGDYSIGWWFYGPWSPSQAQQSLAYKELFPVVIAAHHWGSHWSRRHVLFPSDNEEVVTLLTSTASKVPELMHLLCNLLLVAVHLGFTSSLVHGPGIQNKVTDAISHFRWQEFRRLAPSYLLSNTTALAGQPPC